MAGSENPYVGPRPYEIGETLYGREREIGELYYLLAAERIVLLHSPSGAGKSSLVQAGLIPRLRERFDVWRPTRVNQEPGADPAAGNRYALSAIAGFEEGIPEALRRPPAELAGLRLLDYVRARPKRPGAPASTLLIFDQFEEVLTVDPLGLSAKRELFDQLGELLRDPEIWALFVLREDYLAPLDPYARQVPTHLQNRYRLDLLGREAAAEAIVRPARAGGRDFTPEAVERLVGDLATVKVQQPDGSFAAEAGPHVEPVQLQVVCRRLWGELPAETATIDLPELERFGDVTEALAAYYRGAVEKVGGSRAGERRIREWFERGLIKAGGIRGQVLRGGPECAGLDGAIGALLGTHLIRAEKRAGATWYELAHDRLIEPVQRDNAAWFRDHLSEVERGAALWEAEGRPGSLLPSGTALTEAQAWAAAHAGEVGEAERRFLAAAAEAETAATAEDRRRQLEEQARQARRARRQALIATTGLVLALCGAFYARTQRHRAEHETQRAQDLFRAATAGNLLADGKTTRGNLVALEIEKPETTQTALATLHRALASLAETATLSGHRGPIRGAAWSPDSQRVATAGEDGTARIWNAADGKRLATLTGHGGAVTTVDWSPDGRHLLTASLDGTARLWDTASGRALSTLAGHTDAVRTAAFRPDGRRIATASDDGTARLWNADTGALEATLRLGGPVRVAAWSPDGRHLATVAGDSRIWDAESGRPLATLAHGQEVTAVAWSPDGQRLLTASEDRTARVWSAGGERLVTVEHDGAVRAVAWSPDGKRFITTSDDATARIWHAATGQALVTLVGHSGPVLAAAFGADGTRVVTASADETARVWSTTTGAALTTMRGHDGPLRTVAWSPDDRRAITASSDDTARIWTLSAGETLATLAGHAGPVRAAAWSPDGHRLATASNDGSARLWDAVSGRTLVVLNGHAGEVRAIAWSPDGRSVATGSEDRTAKIWDAATGACRRTLPHEGTVRGVAWSPDGHTLATAALDGAARLFRVDHDAAPLVLRHGERSWVLSVRWSPDGRSVVTASTDRTARIWDAATGRPLAILTGHRDSVWSAVWSPDGRAVATSSMDGTVGLWEAASGRRFFSLQHEGKVFAAAWTPDGTRLATVSGDDTARLWDVADGHLLAVLRGHDAPVFAAAVSPDGRQVATASEDGTARIWNAHNGEPLALLRGHDAALTAIAWSPEGDRLLTASADKTARLWAGSAFLLQAEIRARTPLCLDPGERQQFLAETPAEAREYAADCERCAKLFFRDLGSARPADWQAHRKAWQGYKKCVYAAM